ncbi:MAG TPA: NUDIX hydrolase [Candidatus Xenobia bacterium]|nr:NUDIX hydrolase [Candidatus Xenobia bacterium]
MKRNPKAVVRRSQVAFRGRVFRVRRDWVEEPAVRGAGRRPAAMREIVEHGGSVVVLPVFADGHILLVRQYRHAADSFLWELVAGHIEPNERPVEAARRELREETGYEARRFKRLLTFFPTPGFLTERMHLYRATGLRAGPSRPEEDEDFEVRAFSRRELERMLNRNELRDGKTLVGVLLELARRRA